jgi:esterase/lipase superfamily enzyme
MKYFSSEYRIAMHILVGVFVLIQQGCAGPALPPTPNIYRSGHVAPMTDIPKARQTVEVDILYATDRMPVESGGDETDYYDERRSDSLAVGSVTVRFGEGLAWDDLLRVSLEEEAERVPLEIVTVNKKIQFPSSITLAVMTEDGLSYTPEFLAAREEAARLVREEMSRRLAGADCKEVYVYVHGVGNSFSDPMYQMAGLWHYMGRPGVPVVYTWPAIKGGGLLRGYTYARESSEFTVYHLRQFLQAVASCPDVERIHILAHSRGTGVTISVLQHLRLMYMDDPDRGKKELKLGNVILAAPDIDLQVAQQRFRPDQVYDILDRLTVYVTPEDSALGIAELLFSSLTRLGTATAEDYSPDRIAAMNSGELGADPIEVKVKDKGSHGHTYWIDNQAVLSDVILILRDDLAPGADNGRPLFRAESGFWEIHDGYPHVKDPTEPKP